MPKKSKPSNIKYALELIKYQWESLRTNPEYTKEYRQFKRIISKPKCNYNRFYPRLYYFFQNKYGIDPLDPSFPFPDKPVKLPKNHDLDGKEFKQFILWIYFVDMVHAAQCLTPQIENLIKRPQETTFFANKPLTSHELANLHSILVSINIASPIDRILKDVSEIVMDWKKKKLALGEKQQTVRHRAREYKNYFRVYKLKSKCSDWEKIAKQCYPADYTRDKHYAIRKVKRDYARWGKIGYLFKNNPLLAYKMSYSFANKYPELLTQKEYFLRFQEHCRKELTKPA